MEEKILTKDKLKEKVFKVSTFKPAIKRTKPHKHGGYYELIFLSQGEGFHWIESQHFRLSPPDLYFMKPDQMHCWQFTDIPKGYVLLFRDSMLDPIREAPLLGLIHQLKAVTRISLPGNFDLEPTFQGMLHEYEHPTPYASEIILGHLRTLFALLLKFSPQQKLNGAIGQTPSAIYQKFTELLNEMGNGKNLNVGDFAEKLGTSVQNLNAICKKHGNRSTSQHVTSQLLLEAKRNILHTDMTLNELADFLGFNDASYFVKFFKKHTGQTPYQFRQNYLG
ncbi:helix-turn-helix domain-containing protein [Pleomorphovibrio marinus]|uniref:helix-turn-helix domain-containing protein n=1 Tax=Pleomorphovibrio marinus TaxID=2164132 RepID=UPI000E0C9EB8|nr:AraC family transcriptional regulator [Pleomorphovibrio marinus]